MDLFEWKKTTFLLVVNYYSRYIEIGQLFKLTADVITHCRSIFARHGIPEVVISDNRPQFAAEKFTEFSKSTSFTMSLAVPITL